MEQKESKNSLRRGLFLSALTIAVFIFIISAPASSAGVFDSITNFFQGSSSQKITNNTPPNVPLYKPVVDYEQAVVRAVKETSPAVVSITISKNVPIIENCPMNSPFGGLSPEWERFFGDQFQLSVPCEKGTALKEVGGGSGFIISSDGLIITNRHVISDSKASYTVFTNDGKKYEATVLARDPVQDLAVLKIEARNLPIVRLGDSDGLSLGQTAIAIGNALAEYRNTVSVGVISGLSRTVTAGNGLGQAETIRNVIQTDAAINPGNSGGPLINLQGEVVGINTATVLDAQSVGFAIPVNIAKRVINSVKKFGEIQSPYLGVRYIMITPDLAEKEKLKILSGALVRGNDDGPAVVPGSPAEKSGILAEDIIISINGKKLDREADLSSIIQTLEVGQKVSLFINRKGKEMTFTVTLEKRPKE